METLLNPLESNYLQLNIYILLLVWNGLDRTFQPLNYSAFVLYDKESSNPGSATGYDQTTP